MQTLKIEFFSTVAGVSDAFPIYSAKDYRADWMNLAREDYVKTKAAKKERFEHVFQCPGIFDLFNHGFIVPMWHDLAIMADANNKGFGWKIPSKELPLLKGGDIVGTHKPGLDKFIPKRPWSLDQVIKLNTPWRVIAPKGIKFLMIPVAYADDLDFESSIGLLDPALSCEINMQLWWNKRSGEKLLKAGTPMLHLIPLTEQKCELLVRDMTDHDKKWLDKFEYLNSYSFSPVRNILRNVFYKHFKL